jgi:hypothetical protein
MELARTLFFSAYGYTVVYSLIIEQILHAPQELLEGQWPYAQGLEADLRGV